MSWRVEKRRQSRQQFISAAEKQEMVAAGEDGELRVGNEPVHFNGVLGANTSAYLPPESCCWRPYPTMKAAAARMAAAISARLVNVFIVSLLFIHFIALSSSARRS